MSQGELFARQQFEDAHGREPKDMDEVRAWSKTLPNAIIRISLSAAVASILGKRDHEAYRNIGQKMNVKDLYKLLGLSNSPMLYNYMSGKTRTIEPERALVFLEKFDILIEDWLTEEELRDDATNTEISAQIAREPIKDIIESIVEIESNEDIYALRRGLRKLIARYY